MVPERTQSCQFGNPFIFVPLIFALFDSFRHIILAITTFLSLQIALEAELRGKIDECDKLQQRLRLTQERALDEWMFDGQSDLI